MRRGLFFVILLSSFVVLRAQELSNHRSLSLSVNRDSMQIDSLSIIPGSFKIHYSNKEAVPDSLFRLDPYRSYLFFAPELKAVTDSVQIRFRVFPINFSAESRRKEPGLGTIDPLRKSRFYTLPESPNPFDPAGSSLNTSGNLSRGIQIGNNQDASLSSNLNLQLHGAINRDFRIEAQLSDSNIPVQPEGNTQQIRDFDRFFMRIYSDKTQLLAGDFVLDSPEGYFIRNNKNLQGAQIQTVVSPSTEREGTLRVRGTAAVAKGKTYRMPLAGMEGNQGPYRLYGRDGELYIQLIAGSEQVYLDGKLLTRGENEDYTINYNTAEISFTPRVLMTKDKRIIVQFEYTERSFTRFLVAADTRWKNKNGDFYLNVYSESDARNQPLLQELNTDQKNLLASIGDQLDQARVENIYETAFVNDRVLYKKTDTLVAGIPYKEVLVYSTHPDSAKFQAGFSFVGEHQGNYLPVKSAANGQVYEWTAPVNGIPSGSYEPQTRLIAPQSKQVYSLGTRQQISQAMNIGAELAITSNDRNTFSKLDAADNYGLGLRLSADRHDYLNKDQSLILNSFIQYRRSGKQFDPIETFRSVEFERDWNLNEQLPTQTENLLKAGFILKGKDSLEAHYYAEHLNYQNLYAAWRQNTAGTIQRQGFLLNWTGSYLKSSDRFRETRFLRHEVSLQKTWKLLAVKARERHEQNRWTLPGSSTLEGGSFQFQEWELELLNPKSQGIPWFAKILNRTDYLPDSLGLISDSRAWESSAGLNFAGKKGQNTRFSINWRNLHNQNPELDIPTSDQTMTLRAEEGFQLGNGALSSRTFYEIGSGLERKQDFYYLEVAPGQGYYTWTDYNGNAIKELDEFEPAVFSDQARFIRVFRPGNEYLPVYSNRFTQSFNFHPGRLLKNQKKEANILDRFSNQFTLNANRRSSRTDLIRNLNPFLWEDSLLVSLQSQIRNSLVFNTKNQKFGLDYIFQQTENQNLMSYGTDSRSNQSHFLVSRFHLLDPLWINTKTEKGQSSYQSSFFQTRNYLLGFWRNELALVLESGDQTRINLIWKWSQEENQEGSENLLENRIELGGDYQMPGKGSLHLDLQFIHLNFEGLPDSPVGYVLLKGFRPGNNGMVNLSLRRKLNELIEMDINYSGRLSQSSRMIHTGNISVRAVF